MSEQGMSRRNFLVGAGAAVGLVAVGGLAVNTSEANAEVKAFPWAYTVQDAEKLGRRAYECYYTQGGCAEATWWPVVEALAADASNADAALWATLPKKMFAFGGGGVGGWGTVCGTCNGSCAAAKAVGAPQSIVDEMMVHYAETPIPSVAAETSHAKGDWTIAAPAVLPRLNVPTTIGHTQLCHASISQWTTMTGFADGGAEQKDRCAKACYDMMFQLVTVLNEWKNSGGQPVVTLDPTVGQCASSCHAANGIAPQKTKMACDSCHEETLTDGHALPNFGE